MHSGYHAQCQREWRRGADEAGSRPLRPHRVTSPPGDRDASRDGGEAAKRSGRRRRSSTAMEKKRRGGGRLRIGPPGGQEDIVLYVTLLRGLRKTFGDCEMIRELLKAIYEVLHQQIWE